MAPVRAVTLLKGLISSTWVPWAPRRGSGPRLRLCNRAAPSGESCRQARRPPVLGGLCRCVPGCPGRDPVVDRVPPRSRVTRVTTGSRSAPVPSTCQSTATSPAMQATHAASGRSSAQPYPTARLPCSALCSIAPPAATVVESLVGASSLWSPCSRPSTRPARPSASCTASPCSSQRRRRRGMLRRLYGQPLLCIHPLWRRAVVCRLRQRVGHFLVGGDDING